MTSGKAGSLAISLVLCAAAGSLVACEEKKTESAPALDAGTVTDKYATADPKLENALRAAASAAPADENGPPPAGFFAPGVADKRHPKGAPTKVDTISDGSEPRIDLSGSTPDAVRTSSYGPAALELAMQLGPRSAMPTVDLGLSLGPGKAGSGGPDWLVADVKKASPAKEQFGALPPGTEQAIASLDGSQVRVKLSADGAESEVQMDLGKQTDPSLLRLVQTAAEGIAMATIPLPSKPVGAGAQWIAESRMPFAGLDVIAYRAFRVKSIDGNRVRLSVSVKAYSADTDTHLQGLPKGATLEQLEAQGDGEMELVKGEMLARRSDVREQLVLVFQAPNAAPAPEQADPTGQAQPPGMGTLTAQMQTQATFVRGEDLRAALKGASHDPHAAP